MPDHTNKASAGLIKRSPTIGGLMWIVFIVGVSLSLTRSGVAILPTLLILVLVLPWISAPVLIKRRHWSTSDPRYEPYDLQSQETPEPVAGSVTAISPQMEALGFRNRGLFRASNLVPNGEAHVTLFENRQSRQYAKLFTVIVGVGPIRRVETSLAFFTEFTDGSTLVTGNNRTRPLTPRVRIHNGSMAFPSVRDPRRLYEIHTAIVARFGADANRAELTIQDAAEFLRKSQLKEQAKYAETGYYYLDEERRVYRLTWRGAIFMSWKLLWPVKPIRAMLSQCKAARLLREVGMGL